MIYEYKRKMLYKFLMRKKDPERTCFLALPAEAARIVVTRERSGAHVAHLERFADELRLIEKSYTQYLGLTQALRLSQPKFMEQFRRMLMSKLRVVFESASAELEMWNKSASAQVDAQLRERRRAFRRRREALERIQAAAGELETRLAELEARFAGRRIIGMIIFHIHITSTFPLAVPLEWNLFMIFGLLFLFGAFLACHHVRPGIACAAAGRRATGRAS